MLTKKFEYLIFYVWNYEEFLILNPLLKYFFFNFGDKIV